MPSEFPLHGGDGFVHDAAGHDMVEHAQIGIHIQGQAMHGNEAAALDADGRDLSLARSVNVQPYAYAVRDDPRMNAIAFQGGNYGPFNAFHEFFHTQVQRFQIEDRIRDELAGTVVGDVAASFYLVSIRAHAFQ